MFAGRFLPRRRKRHQDAGAALSLLSNRLGFRRNGGPAPAPSHPTPPPAQSLALRVLPTEDAARPVYYSPAMDGQPEPGEVVWVWAPGRYSNLPQERAMLVVGHTQDSLLCLVISPDSQHSTDPKWMRVGTGDWDAKGRPAWVRLDRVVEVPLRDIRRSGAIVPRGRFERIASTLRNTFGWS